MAKVILISIQPKWVAKILNGEKTLEIRKTMPKCDYPIDVYIYCTKQGILAKIKNVWRYIKGKNYNPYFGYQGKVVAKFTLNNVEEIEHRLLERHFTKTIGDRELLTESCLTHNEMHGYLKCESGYAWHINNLVPLDEPKPLSQFLIPSHKVQGIDKNGSEKTFTILKPLNRAPQSWCFVEL